MFSFYDSVYRLGGHCLAAHNKFLSLGLLISLVVLQHVKRTSSIIRILVYEQHWVDMLIKGEKYACDACVRGHRVSNCRHADRPLQHINKKARGAPLVNVTAAC